MFIGLVDREAPRDTLKYYKLMPKYLDDKTLLLKILLILDRGRREINIQ